MPKHHIAGAAALILATAPAAWADIDAKTIWSDWQDVATRFGGTLTAGSEDYAGGTLTLTDVSMETDFAGSEDLSDYGTIRMVEQGDGTVRIEVPEKMSSTSTTTVEDVTVKQRIDMTYDGADIVASEDGGVRSYDMTIDRMTAVIGTDAEVDGADGGKAGGAGDANMPPEVTFSLSNLVSTYRSGIDGDADAFDQSLTADDLDVTAAVRGDDGGETFDVTYALNGITSQIAGAYGDAPTGPIEGLSDLGFTYAGDFSHSGGMLNVTGEGEQGPFSVKSTSGAGTLTLDLAEESLGYIVSSTDIDATVESPGFPVPISLSMAESTVGIALPKGKSDVAKPFALSVAARELVLDDALWGLFDPTGQLPRDPATLMLDMDGTAVMNVDLFGDPQAMAKLQGAPGDLKTLAIKQILLTLAGAELRGSGDLEFPKVTPVPEPVGTIELALDGGFALADKLVALGFIPAEQAAFFKGMAGAVTRSVGDDQLESTIEFTPGGGISANGLALK